MLAAAIHLHPRFSMAFLTGAPARIWTRVGKIQLKKKSARSLEYFTELTEPHRLPPLEYFTEHTEPRRLPPPSNILRNIRNLTDNPPSNILRNLRNLADYPPPSNIYLRNIRNLTDNPLEYFTELLRNLTDPPPLKYFTEHTEPHRLPPLEFTRILLKERGKNVEKTWWDNFGKLLGQNKKLQGQLSQ